MPTSHTHFSASIQRLIALIGGHKTMTPALARACLRQAEVRREEMALFSDFEHPVEDSYGRKLVYNGGFFEIMVMSWLPGDFSAIHDHGTAQWGAVQYFGQAEHAVFALQDHLLTTQSRTRVQSSRVNAVDHDLIHQMGNPDQPPFCSLHLYGSYDHDGKITGNARLFDLFEGKIQLTDAGVFFCLPETDIKRRLDGPAADLSTTLRHHRDMLHRIRRMLPTSEDPELLRGKARALKQRIRSLEPVGAPA